MERQIHKHLEINEGVMSEGRRQKRKGGQGEQGDKELEFNS